jgi:hypothetical protein
MKNINVDRSIVCFGNRFLQGKEEAPEATTNQTIEVTAAEEKPDGTKISVGTDGVDVSTKMEQTQLA